MKSFTRRLLQNGTVLLGILAAPSAFAGGAFSTTPLGEPVLWQGPVVWHAETGPIKGNTPADGGGGGGGGGGGCQMTKSLDVGNTEALDIVRAAFDAWETVPNSSLDIQEGASLGVDVNFDNIENFWVGSFFGGSVGSTASAAPCYDADPANDGDCKNAVIFDSSNVPERSIVDAIQGQCARYSILAFAAILPQQSNDAQQTITSKILKSSQMVISGACLAPVIAPDPACDNPATPDNEGACPAGGITLDELKGTVTHEVGHFLGLDHTLTNKKNYIDCQTSSTDCVLENIPTMIGLFVKGANLSTLHYDDKVAFSRYYPSAGQAAATCTIKGSAFNSSNTADARCMEVVASLNNDPATTASFVVGSEAKRFTQGIAGASGTSGKNQDNCNAGSDAACGAFEFRGLTAGNYTMYLQNFDDGPADTGLGSFVLEPCTPPLTNAAFADTKGTARQVNVVCTNGATTNQNLQAN